MTIVRFQCEIQVEVLDVTAASAYLMNWSRTEDGEVAMLDPRPVLEEIANAVQMTIAESLKALGPARGFAYRGVSRTTIPTDQPYPD